MRLKATGTLTPEVMEAVTPIVPLLKAVMREHYDWLQLTYEFYSVMGTSMDLSTMQKNQYVGGGERRGVEEAMRRSGVEEELIGRGKKGESIEVTKMSA